MWSLLAKLVVNKKKKKAKENFADNKVHNILRLFDFSLDFTFTTSETMGDY